MAIRELMENGAYTEAVLSFLKDIGAGKVRTGALNGDGAEPMESFSSPSLGNLCEGNQGRGSGRG